MDGRVSVSVLVFVFTILTVNCDQYSPRKLAEVLISSGASEWEIPFLVYISAAKTNFTTDFKSQDVSFEDPFQVRIRPDYYTGIFALSDDIRIEYGCPIHPSHDVMNDAACMVKIFRNMKTIRQKSQILQGLKVDSNMDFWYELSNVQMNSTVKNCDNSSGLAVNLLLIIVDSLLIFLCFVLYLYVKDQNRLNTMVSQTGDDFSGNTKQ
ncbi:hypothetical protein GE061_007405 [Apolygus lucorum]|uniref:Uncharacterized protein n=1 Tax=Apolygus lucorum TaxID=248454 RepID=A0A8S9WT60_APOLU|nr:hypothetical protein GE061_007405 [Apolygus lucorum]